MIHNKILALTLLLFIQFSAFGSHEIYLIHGFKGFKRNMHKIDKHLQEQNFTTKNYGYKSSIELDSLGKQLYEEIKTSKIDTVSFVTFSMGALVFRSMLQYSVEDKDFPKIFRIVMIAPPNGGANVANFYASNAVFRCLLGPNIQKMKTDSTSYANNLPKPYNIELGIIAGVRKKERGYNRFIKGDNDGVVALDNTKLGMEKDFIMVKGRHNRLIRKKHVSFLVSTFLKTGVFNML